MKLNQIFKIVIFTLISLCSFSSYSRNQNIEFNLKCKVEVEISHNMGHIKTDKSELIVEVKNDSKKKYIGLNSTNENANNIFVLVPPPNFNDGEFRTSQDSSDENKFEMTYSYRTKNNYSSYTKIYLNRNNGEIIVTRESKNGNDLIKTSIGGTCEKIDTTKKKF